MGTLKYCDRGVNTEMELGPFFTLKIWQDMINILVHGLFYEKIGPSGCKIKKNFSATVSFSSVPWLFSARK